MSSKNGKSLYTSNAVTVSSFRALKYTLLAVVLSWSALFAGLLSWAYKDANDRFISNIDLKAQMLYQNTQALRRWVGDHGGIYVEVGNGIKPNPLLEDLPERDLVTPSGRRLTLYNSPLVLHNIMGEFEAESGNRVRLISDNPISPANKPDKWENDALKKFGSGAAQVSELIEDEAQTLYRLARPIKLYEKCFDCHHHDNYQVGDTIGAVSVSIDTSPEINSYHQHRGGMTLSFIGMWAVGLLGLLWGSRHWRILLSNLEQSVIKDPLTGLYNRRELMTRLEVELSNCKRHNDRLTVIMLDIDLFKHVNDTYGHQAGDDVLKAFAGIVQSNVRVNDFVARYGGEEFLVVCPRTHMKSGIEVAERIRQAVMETPLDTRKGKLNVTVSAGVSCDQKNDSVALLINAADEALYAAKQQGRNKVCSATSS